MNPVLTPRPTPARPRFTRWAVLFLVTVGLPTAAVATVIMSFRVGSESRAARDIVLQANPDGFHRQFELGLGRLPVGLARAALGFVPMEPEAPTLRSADVSIYTHDAGTDGIARGRILTRVREAMKARGWIPAVSVLDGEDLVGVFIPEKMRSPESFAACVLVLDAENLVIASGRLNLRPLADFALRELASRGEPHVGGLLSLAALRP